MDKQSILNINWSIGKDTVRNCVVNIPCGQGMRLAEVKTELVVSMQEFPNDW